MINFKTVRWKNFLSTGIEWLPINSVNLSGEDKENAIKFLESLEDNEDVQSVSSNFEVSDEILEVLTQ